MVSPRFFQELEDEQCSMCRALQGRLTQITAECSALDVDNQRLRERKAELTGSQKLLLESISRLCHQVIRLEAEITDLTEKADAT